MVTATPWPLYSWESDLVPIVLRAWWSPGLVCPVGGSLTSTGIWSPDHPAHSEMLSDCTILCHIHPVLIKLHAGWSRVRFSTRDVLFLKMSEPASGPRQSLIQWVLGIFTCATYFQLVLKLRMSRSVPPLPLPASMACTGTNLPFFKINKVNTWGGGKMGHQWLKLRGLSPRANYTDRAAAAGRRS